MPLAAALPPSGEVVLRASGPTRDDRPVRFRFAIAVVLLTFGAAARIGIRQATLRDQHAVSQQTRQLDRLKSERLALRLKVVAGAGVSSLLLREPVNSEEGASPAGQQRTTLRGDAFPTTDSERATQ